jgi:hypothetical protein
MFIVQTKYIHFFDLKGGAAAEQEKNFSIRRIRDISGEVEDFNKVE